jgi:hypothetical protein
MSIDLECFFGNVKVPDFSERVDVRVFECYAMVGGVEGQVEHGVSTTILIQHLFSTTNNTAPHRSPLISLPSHTISHSIFPTREVEQQTNLIPRERAQIQLLSKQTSSLD